MSFDRAAYLAGVARMERSGEIHQLTLPSGATVRLRRLMPEEWLNRAILPQALALAAFKRFAAGSDEVAITDSDIVRLAEVRADICAAVLVEPRLVPDEVVCGEGELHYRELGAEDASAVFDWAMRREEAARLESFRDERAVPDAGGGGRAVQGAPQRPGRHRRPDHGA